MTLIDPLIALVDFPEVLEDARLGLSYTVETYYKLIDVGVIKEGAPYELLEGQVVRKLRNQLGEDPMTIYPGHTWAVESLAALNSRLRRSGCTIRTQNPIHLPPRSEPEPDGAIARGTKDDYRSRHPSPADLLCVFEVADASLQRDRTVKQRVYANAKIPLYVIVNLIDRVVEVYTEPMVGKGRYANVATLMPKDRLVLPTVKGKGLTIQVRSLLP